MIRLVVNDADGLICTECNCRCHDNQPEVKIMTPEELIRTVRTTASQSTPLERANLLYDLARAVYDAVKFDNPEGHGLDGRDGPERQSLGLVCDEAQRHTQRINTPQNHSQPKH